MKTIIINEEQLDFIKRNQDYTKNNSLEIFKYEIKQFLYYIMTNKTDDISEYWQVNGIKKGDLFRLLKRYNIITVDDINKEIKVKKKNFDKNISRLYYELFDNTPNNIIVEDGEGDMGGGTSCSSVGGSYEIPLFGLQRRKIAK